MSVASICYEELHDAGCYHYAFDLDGTLMKVDSEKVDPDNLKAIWDAQDAGYIRSAAVVSNAWVPNRYRLNRVASAAQQIRACCGIPLIPPRLKPGTYGYKAAMRAMKSRPENTVMVGDQLLTDIRGANNLGWYTILVKHLGRDPWFTARKRERENQILRRLHYQQQRVAPQL